MKKKLLALLMGMLLVFGLTACGGDSNDSSSGSSSSGSTAEKTDNNSGGTSGEQSSTASSLNAEELFQSKGCTACHGNDLSGGVGSDLRKIGASRTKDEIKNAIVNGITGEKGTMPAQNVTDEEADALAEWLAAKK